MFALTKLRNPFACHVLRPIHVYSEICGLPRLLQSKAHFSCTLRQRLISTSLVQGKAMSTAVPAPKKKQKQKAMPPRPLWLIKEDEIEEKFIKGGGPGGQKINKSNIKVQITHKPTGIVVNSQDLRSQEKNRAKAREILALRLEQMQNPETCRLGVLTGRKKLLKSTRNSRMTRIRRSCLLLITKWY